MPATFSTARQKVSAFAREKLAEKPLYLDTETTGLERSDEIVEISIIDDDENCVFESLVRPSKPIPAPATRLHGITNEMVQSARPWPTLWPLVRSVLAGRLVVIYNAKFDLRMMEQSHARYRLPWRENLNALCAMELYAQYRGDWDTMRRAYRFFKLEDAGRQCRIALPNAHRARADALLARALFHYMAENE
jgi:DNA polymerase-3 subunit epsilon